MCGDSGLYPITPSFDDSDSIDNLIDEDEYPGLAGKLRSHRVYTIGDLRRRDVRAQMTEWVGTGRARALQELIDDNDGREL